MTELKPAPGFVPPTFIQLQLSFGRILKLPSRHNPNKDEFSIQISSDYIGVEYMKNVAFYSRFVNVFAFHAWINHSKWFLIKTTGVIIDGGEAFHKAIIEEADFRGVGIPDCYNSVVDHHHMWWFLKAGWQHHSHIPAY